MLYRLLIDVSLLVIPILCILGVYLIFTNKYFPRQGRRLIYVLLEKPTRLWGRYA